MSTDLIENCCKTLGRSMRYFLPVFAFYRIPLPGDATVNVSWNAVTTQLPNEVIPMSKPHKFDYIMNLTLFKNFLCM